MAVGDHRDIRVCMAFKFDRKLNSVIPSKTYKNTVKSEKAHLVCFAVLSWLLDSCSERFTSQRLIHVCKLERHSRIQRPWALWPAVGRQERLWGTTGFLR